MPYWIGMSHCLTECIYFRNDENFLLLTWLIHYLMNRTSKVLPDAFVKFIIIWLVRLHFTLTLRINRMKQSMLWYSHSMSISHIWWSLSRTDYENSKWFETLSFSNSDYRINCVLSGNIFYHLYTSDVLSVYTEYVHIFMRPFTLFDMMINGTINLSIHWEYCNPSKHFLMCNCEDRMPRTSDSTYHLYTFEMLFGCAPTLILQLHRMNNWKLAVAFQYVFICCLLCFIVMIIEGRCNDLIKMRNERNIFFIHCSPINLENLTGTVCHFDCVYVSALFMLIIDLFIWIHRR